MIFIQLFDVAAVVLNARDRMVEVAVIKVIHLSLKFQLNVSRFDPSSTAPIQLIISFAVIHVRLLVDGSPRRLNQLVRGHRRQAACFYLVS